MAGKRVGIEPAQFRPLENLQDVLDRDHATIRLIKNRAIHKSRKKDAVVWVKKSEERIRLLRKERKEIEKRLRLKDKDIKNAWLTLERNREKRNKETSKLTLIRYGLASRRAKLMHHAKGILLRQAYRDIGLPLPERLKRIKNLAIFQEEEHDTQEDNRDRGTHSTDL